MDTATETAARHQADQLKLTQWLSPAFPISAYAYSHGLEAEMEEGRVATALEVKAWIERVLMRGAGCVDATLLIAVRRGADVDDMAERATALAGSRERLEETLAQGAAMAATLQSLGIGDGVAHPYPVVLGRASRALTLSDETVAGQFLQSFAGSLASAAVRFIPLGQVDGQVMLAELHFVITKAAAHAAQADISRLGTAVFGADLAAMRHETQEVRLFKT